MAKVIIEFERGEEEDGIHSALYGYKYRNLIWEFDQKLRSVSKYGASIRGNGQASSPEMETCSQLRDVLREMLQEDNLTIE
jgi:hypothetical protein